MKDEFVYKGVTQKEYLQSRAKYNHHSDKCFFDALATIDLSGKTVLDIGCGAGQDFLKYEEMGAQMIIGVDPSEEFIQTAKEKYITQNVRVVMGRSESLPLSDTSVDVVVSKWALQTSPDVPGSFAEIARVCKEGGEICLLVTHPMFQHIAKTRKNRNANYFDNTEISLKVFETIDVTEPSHALQEYLNPNFFKNFRIVSFVEDFEFPSTERIGNDTYPTFFVLRAKKETLL